MKVKFVRWGGKKHENTFLCQNSEEETFDHERW